MKIVLQRINSASVVVENKLIAKGDQGLLLLVGFGQADNEAELAPMAKKICELRIFPNAEGRFDKSVIDIAGDIIAVPQFTLYGSTTKGRRPDFFAALAPEQATVLFDKFCAALDQALGKAVGRGEFGANMLVSLVNEGPVTLVLES